MKPGSGVIEREFGPFEPGAFRLDVADKIVDGDSWQLAAFVAHALDAKNRLAAPDDDATAAILLTGRVDYDLNVLPVEFVAKKLAASRDEFTSLVEGGVPVWVFVHTENLADTDASSLPDGVDIVGADTTAKMLETVAAIQSPNSGPPAVRQGGGLPDTLDPVPEKPRLAANVILVLLIAIAAAVIWYPRIAPHFMASPPAATVEIVASVEEAPAEDMAPEPAAETDDTEQADMAVVSEAEAQTPTTKEEPAAPEAASPVEALPDSETPVIKEPVVAVLGHVEITLFGRHAPGGKTCPAVHFGSAVAVLVAIAPKGPNAFETSPHDGLCGIEFAVENIGEPRYLSAVLQVTSGRFLDTPRPPAGLNGDLPVAGRETWALDILYRMARDLEYRIVVLASETASAEDAAWLKAQSDWDDALTALVARGVEVVWTTHSVIR
ncbi:MAG: hypothetical protein VCD33_15695 [Alphaproteobacteria bacterium]